MADSISTDRAFVKVYETQNFWSVFQPISDYMFELSFLTILNIYKDYFKGRKRLQKLDKSKFHKCEGRYDQKPSLT